MERDRPIHFQTLKMKSPKQKPMAFTSGLRRKLHSLFDKAGPREVPLHPLSRYQMMRHIAAGAHGDVTLYTDSEKGSLVAIKSIHHHDSLNLPHEVRILGSLGQHTNVIRLFAMCRHRTRDERRFLIFENCEMGDLMHCIEQKTPATEAFVWHAFRQLASGLHHLHSHGIVHGDIKPDNILLSSSSYEHDFPTLKIADFGVAQIEPSDKIPRGHCGTWNYCPPEAEDRFGPEHDVWALGCTIHALALKLTVRPRVEYEEGVVKTWFRKADKKVPANTPMPHEYKRFCLFSENNPLKVRRVDEPLNDGTQPRTKLLNYWMMRTLDPNWQTRATTNELHRFLPVLEPFIRKVTSRPERKYESTLNDFDDGPHATDASVLMETFLNAANFTACWDDNEPLKYGSKLLRLMDDVDRKEASEHLRVLGLRLPGRSRWSMFHIARTAVSLRKISK